MNSPASLVGGSWQRIFLKVSFMIAVLLSLQTVLLQPLWANPPEPEKAVRGPCIRDATWMRRNHMDFLKHKRVETVREGIRVKSESFLACASCHQSRERFCDRCHAYVAVAPNCFDCHQYPK